MGQLVDGKWVEEDLPQNLPHNNHHRIPSNEFPAEAGRYVLYITRSCPFAQRAEILIKLKHLEKLVTAVIADPVNTEKGWSFKTGFPDATGDIALGKQYLHEIYQLSDPHYTGRVTVPALFDTKTNRLVNNESAEIIEIFNKGFDGLEGVSTDVDYAAADDSELLDFIMGNIAGSLYQASSITTQEEYDATSTTVFGALDELEARLADDSSNPKKKQVPPRHQQLDTTRYKALRRLSAP